MDADRSDEVDGLLAAHQLFGRARLASSRTLQSFSLAGQQGAANLLVRAERALDRGEPDRARAYVDRAVRLPYDEHEQTHPLAMEVHMQLFCLVTDTLENCDEDDSRWLDAAIAVLPTADESGRCTLRDVLVAIDSDYRLSRAERAALRSAIAGVPDRPELRDLELPAQELSDCAMSVLAVHRDYRAAVSRLV